MLNLLEVFCFVLKPVLELIIMYITNYSSLFPMTKSGESMQFLKAIEYANARLTIKEATEPPTFGR
jgi:hypothetical protein